MDTDSQSCWGTFGCGFTIGLLLVLTILKLAGLITWAWWVIFLAPIFLFLVCIFFLFIIGFILGALSMLLD